jgi:uroporphyrinogen-III synthase
MTPERSVISTQPVEQAQKLQQALENQTIAFYNMPMIRTEAYALNDSIRETLQKLHEYDWIIFTSKNGVHALFQLINEAGLTFPEKLKTAVIGKTTQSHLEKVHRKADFINRGQTSVEFLAALKNEIIKKNDRILMVLGNLAPNHMQQQLSKIAQVDRLDVYKTLSIADYDKTLMQNIRSNGYGLLVFTSPSAFQNFYKFYQLEKSIAPLRIVSIGNITTAAIQKITQAQIITAKTAGIDGLKNEIIHYFKIK